MRSMRTSMEGWGSGLTGVIIFSGSLPATRVAVADFSPLFLTSARAVIAALLGAALLLALRQRKPSRDTLFSLAIVALGVVVGFPLLTALALQYVTSAHSIVFVGLLPLATAFFGVLRGGERPKPLFWLFSGIGSATVVGFALSSGGDVSLVEDSKRPLGSVFTARVDVTEWLGDSQYAYIPYDAPEDVTQQLKELSRELDSDQLRTQAIVSIDATSRIREGRDAEFWLDSRKVHVFDPETGDNLTRDAEAGAELTRLAAEDRVEQVEHARQSTG